MNCVTEKNSFSHLMVPNFIEIVKHYTMLRGLSMIGKRNKKLIRIMFSYCENFFTATASIIFTIWNPLAMY